MIQTPDHPWLTSSNIQLQRGSEFMIAKELKERLGNCQDNAEVFVLNTKTGWVEKAQMPHATDVDGSLVVLFEPEGWQ
jgi:hypothetical protein